MHHRLLDDIEHNRDRVRLVVLPPPCPLSVQPTDFSRADELITRGREDARRFFADGGEDRPAIRMRPHSHRRSHAAR